MNHWPWDSKMCVALRESWSLGLHCHIYHKVWGFLFTLVTGFDDVLQATCTIKQTNKIGYLYPSICNKTARKPHPLCLSELHLLQSVITHPQICTHCPAHCNTHEIFEPLHEMHSASESAFPAFLLGATHSSLHSLLAYHFSCKTSWIISQIELPSSSLLFTIPCWM